MNKKKSKKEKTETIERILNCEPSDKRERDWEYDDALDAGILEGDAVEPIPETIDLREKWWEIGDQESKGSCVGWATADSVIRWHLVKAGKLTQEEPLSVRYVWMASKETDIFTSRPTTFIEKAGTKIKSALDIARKFGVVRESILPLKPGELYNNKPEIFYSIASQLKISSYYNLRRNQNKWRRWLATEGPIATRLDVDKTWDNAKSTKGNLDEYFKDTVRGGHAIALVGYTADRFIVRNSWGVETWGDEGFGYASLDYASAAFTEAYGIKVY